MKKIYVAGILGIVMLFLSLPVRAYVTKKSIAVGGSIVQNKWTTSAFPIRWQLNPAQGPNVTGTRTQAEVFAQSFQTWQSLSTASIAFTEGPDANPSVRPGEFDGINLVTTKTSASDMPAGCLALTTVFYWDGTPNSVDPFSRPVDFPGQILEADIFFNATTPFTTNVTATPDRVDLQSVATHEIGHFLGLDHSAAVSATMFWTIASGFIYPRVLSSDDIAAISTIYPAGSFATKGKISGIVRTTANAPVFGATVVAVNSAGIPVAGAVTDPNGAYIIEGLDAGAYTVYAEPLDGPITVNNISTLPTIYPGVSVNTNFKTRFR